MVRQVWIWKKNLLYCLDLKMHAGIDLPALFDAVDVRTAAVVVAAYAVVVVVIEHAAAAAVGAVVVEEVGDHENSKLDGSVHPWWVLDERGGGGGIVVVYVAGHKAVLYGIVPEIVNDQDGIFERVIEPDPYQGSHGDHW